MKFRNLLAIVVAFGLILAACGDDDDTSTTDSSEEGGNDSGGESGGDVSAYATVFADFIREDDEDFEVTEEEADCAGEVIAEVIGETRLSAEGDADALKLALEDSGDLGTFALSSDEGVEIGNGLLECIPSITDQMVAQMADGDEATEQCVSEALTDELVAKVFGAALAGTEMGEELEAEFQAALMECAPA